MWPERFPSVLSLCPAGVSGVFPGAGALQSSGLTRIWHLPGPSPAVQYPWFGASAAPSLPTPWRRAGCSSLIVLGHPGRVRSTSEPFQLEEGGTFCLLCPFSQLKTPWSVTVCGFRSLFWERLRVGEKGQCPSSDTAQTLEPSEATKVGNSHVSRSHDASASRGTQPVFPAAEGGWSGWWSSLSWGVESRT